MQRGKNISFLLRPDRSPAGAKRRCTRLYLHRQGEKKIKGIWLKWMGVMLSKISRGGKKKENTSLKMFFSLLGSFPPAGFKAQMKIWKWAAGRFRWRWSQTPNDTWCLSASLWRWFGSRSTCSWPGQKTEWDTLQNELWLVTRKPEQQSSPDAPNVTFAVDH